VEAATALLLVRLRARLGDVKYDYGLTVTEGEKSSLEEMLDTCLVGG
jgi:hypothetical protein